MIHHSHDDGSCSHEQMVLSAVTFAREVVAPGLDAPRVRAITRDGAADTGEYVTDSKHLPRRQADFLFGVAAGAQAGIAAAMGTLIGQIDTSASISALEGVPLEFAVNGKSYRIGMPMPLSEEDDEDAGLRMAVSLAVRQYVEGRGGEVVDS